ncbi:hypothetical protein [Novosphingobium sp.]|uniref:hypothetical protein n=1 Tax=Novosphingobium sp. TaxID=1874826 RepID=UPI003B52680B
MLGKFSGKDKSFSGALAMGFGGVLLVIGAAGAAQAQVGAQVGAGGVSTGVGTPFELAFWQSIDSSNDPSLYDAYLAHFPNGTFSDIAHAKIISLRGRVSAPATPALTVPIAPQLQPVAASPDATAVRVMQPAVPVVQPIAAPAPVVGPIAPPSQVAVAPAVATTAPPAGTLGQLLAALAVSQSNDAGGGAAPQQAVLQSANLVSGPAQMASAPAPMAPHPTAVSFAMPAQPALSPVPAVAFPASFCSAEQRNAFHDQVYAPSVGTAKHNNEAAAAYLRQLQALYDQYQTSRDPDTMNAIVVAARQYEQVAQTTYSMQASLVRQFGTLMAVPVVACAQPAQPTAALLVK